MPKVTSLYSTKALIASRSAAFALISRSSFLKSIAASSLRFSKCASNLRSACALKTVYKWTISGSSSAQSSTSSTARAFRAAAVPSSMTSKRGSIPASAGCARRISEHRLWIVPMRAASIPASRSAQCFFSLASPADSARSLTALRTRLRISRAAFSVKVIATTLRGDFPSSSSRTYRATRVRVFPVPAPAVTMTSLFRHSTASRCSPVRLASR